MWYVLNSLQIDCITFIDLDNERVCGGYKKLKEIINCMKEIKENFNLEYSDGKSIFDENIDIGLMKNPYDLNNVYIKDIYLLCSDGLWSVVTDAEIEEILGKALSLKEKGQKLYYLAKEKKNQDNISHRSRFRGIKNFLVEYTF